VAISRYHFLGICGVAMAQVAAWMKSQGAEVTGSDEGVYPPMSEFLAAQGITVLSPYRPENLKTVDAVVIGNSISRGNPELEAVLEKRLPFLSLPELIHSQVLRQKFPIVVSGTHGKTTTTAALAQILKTAQLAPGFMIGGLPVGWESGFEGGRGEWFAIEGDEYDSAFFDKRPKFLHYQPQIALINNIEFDHADIYNSLDEILLQFRRLIQLVPRNGCLIINGDESVKVLAEKAPCPVITFSVKDKTDVYGELIEISPEGMQFHLKLAAGQQVECHSTLWGEHQLANLVAAAAAAEFAGVTPPQIVAGIEAFRGVRRRMELKFHHGGIWFYEDFAHHPTAVKATIAGLKARHPSATITAAFEPRSNTMVRNFLQNDLITALSLADRIIIGQIHRRDKILPDQRLDVEAVVNSLRHMGKEAHYAVNTDEIIRLMSENTASEAVFVAMSNGAFGGIPTRFTEYLATRRQD
jgi:UDP-N-acetylmuramate: L-alanyl-gamma-D-glutamyl-meso-diaminopimelate ligase